MPIERPKGTAPAKKRNKDAGKKGNKGAASKPQPGPQQFLSDRYALNPPFDGRMRRIGSPLNLTNQIRRGWIENEEGNQRVNFLFNPAQLDTAHSVDAEHTKNPIMASETADVMMPFYTSTGSSTGVELLYDRTYELFSQPRTGDGNVTQAGMAAAYGVFADVAAWYVFLGMLPEMPGLWNDSLFTSPMKLVPSYLFMGPKMYFYGFVSSLNVTYSHWTQNMVPQRCKVSVGFTILPKVPDDGTAGNTPLSGAPSNSALADIPYNGFLGSQMDDLNAAVGIQVN